MPSTWDNMQPGLTQIKGAADATDAALSKAQSDLAASKAEVQRLTTALADCEASQPGPGPGPGPEPEPQPPTGRDLGLPPTGKLYMGVSQPGSPNGLAGYVSIVGKNPHIVHSYARSGSEFVSRLNGTPAGTIPLINFKPLGQMGGTAYTDILAGKGDAAIDQAAAAIKAYTKGPLFFAPLHEPENDDKEGIHDANYAKAFRHIVERVRAKGATNAIVVWNMMGFSNWVPRYDKLYPGDDVVDWIGSDPYVISSAAVDTWGEFFNAGTPGMYSWAKPKNKPFMLCEWGIGKAVVATVAPKLLGAAQMTVLHQQFPLVKALVYWNEPGTGNYVLSNFPTQWKAFAALAEFQFAV